MTRRADLSVRRSSMSHRNSNFSHLFCSRSFTGLDQMLQPSPEPCVSMTPPLVPQFSFLGPLLIGTDRCVPGNANKACCFGEARCSSCPVITIKLPQILTLTHSAASRTDCVSQSYISHPLTGATDNQCFIPHLIGAYI